MLFCLFGKTIASLPHIVGEEEWDKNRSLFLKMMDTDGSGA